MRRTIADARQIYEEQLPHLSDYWAGRYRSLLEHREAQAAERAAGLAQQQAEAILAQRSEVLRQLTDARDGYDELATEVKEGRIPASDAARQLQELRTEQAEAEQQLSQLAAQAEALEAIEDDPVVWADEMALRTPRTMSDWPW
jgi:chromosome segregation ATPase